MLRHILSSAIANLALFAGASLTADAQEKLKIISFTADWCNICQIMDPRVSAALASIDDPTISLYPVDLTLSRQGSDPDRVFFRANFHNSLVQRRIDAIYDGYMGYPYTGYSVLLAADTNEALGCLFGLVDLQTTFTTVQSARAVIDQYPAYQRPLINQSCPASFNYLTVRQR